jgi:hypothetical protein
VAGAGLRAPPGMTDHQGDETHMNLPFVMGLIGLVVSAVFAFNSVRELKRDVPGHSRNAAMIHIAMVSMLVPFCLIVMAFYWP